MLISRTLPVFSLFGMLLALSGCTAINSGVGGYFGLDTDLKLTFKVDADINPDERNKPSPLFIRLYELKSTKMFNKSDSFHVIVINSCLDSFKFVLLDDIVQFFFYGSKAFNHVFIK